MDTGAAPTLEERVAAIEDWLKKAEGRDLVKRVEKLEAVHDKFGWVFDLFAPKE